MFESSVLDFTVSHLYFMCRIYILSRIFVYRHYIFITHFVSPLYFYHSFYIAIVFLSYSLFVYIKQCLNFHVTHVLSAVFLMCV